ncbi:DoxX family protein [Aureimonas phyllosphaerae]|uniref:Transmembrane protein n=1 Tax=Aureimonas phyllosphaerae TaxID=1166078 RepID=A0A7W6BPK6_9HYPH|nr:DoxX family protein [Aureimonas phyllosphaerae]MBB3935751.1 transmembrane protein [Aureimonas phyllosphaerae]MBB3959759.1 transmembrane protein [Aureimonas phyllosphaerae]SFF14683.1 transmembrane protein [Aureimonas phyllosphaerae]
MPSAIARLLDTRWFPPIARLILTFCFWGSGLAKLADFEAATAEMAYFGFSPPALVAVLVIVVQLLGSALVILDRAAWLGAGMLATFTGLTILLVHDFWNMTGPEAVDHFHTAAEHVTVIGAMMVAALLSRRMRAGRVATAHGALPA